MTFTVKKRAVLWLVAYLLVVGMLTILSYAYGSSLHLNATCFLLLGCAVIMTFAAAFARNRVIFFPALLVALSILYYPAISYLLFPIKLQMVKDYVAHEASQIDASHPPAQLATAFRFLEYRTVEGGYEFRYPDFASVGCDIYVYDSVTKTWWVDN